MVTGLFKESEGAELASQAVIALGYDRGDINVIMSDDARQRYFPAPKPTIAGADTQEESATGDKLASNKLGGPMGGTVGTLAPIVAAVGVLLIPGLGIVAGPLAIALAAGGAVGLAGGIVGALTHWGIPSSRISEYEAGILAGGVLLGVKTKSESDAGKIQQRWQEQGGEYVHS
jgi:hypothetical protein